MSNSAYRDGPNQLKYEAQQISLTFVKQTPDTATLTWNIPAPVFGCDEDARAYNGIIVIASQSPIKQTDKPVDGTYYTGDATVSEQLHAGDKIGNALVIGAFYDDDFTTTLTAEGVEPLTPYYFAAYAVSAQCIYDPAGAHAYSLPVGKENEYKDFPAYQEIRVLGPANKRFNVRNYKELPTGSMLGQASTSLAVGTTYTTTICSDVLGENVELPIEGAKAQTWDELVVELNRQIALSTNPLMSATAPNTGSLYLNVPNSKLYKWSGEVYNEQELITSISDPAAPSAGSWWFNDVTDVLSLYDGAIWNSVGYVSYHKPYSQIVAGDFWANVSAGFAAKWEGATWCKRSLFTGVADPSIAVGLPGGTFWYDTESGFVHEWDSVKGCWNRVQVIYAAQDPSNLTAGQLWYNDDTNVLHRLTASSTWEEVEARVHEIAAKTPADGDFWINPKTDDVKQYSFAEKKWLAVNLIQWSSDPLNRKSCDKWWNSTSDKLFVWDFLASQWVEVVNFIQNAIDPADAPVLPFESVWISPAGTYIWDNMQWVEQSVLQLNFDPRVPVQDDVTRVSDKFYRYNNGSWEVLDVLTAEGESTVNAGTYWYQPNTMSLNLMTATGWTPAAFVTRPQVPEVGSQYFNTVLQQMMEWRNGKYQVAELPAHFFISDLNNLIAITKTKGSSASVKLGFDVEFKNTIRPSMFGFDAVGGTDGISPQPSYKTQGIGTDGSVDERREYANYVLSQLGYPKVQVELTKRHLDEAIDDALEAIRMRTSAAYTRRYMAMDIFPNQQVYEFTNKKQGLDKVVRVLKIHRTRYGRIGAYSYEDTFGSAMIQQLYSAGSFDLLSYHLLASYNALINTVFANDITFNWNEYSRTLHVEQVLRNKERVLVEVEIEKTEQELLVDRNLRSWMKKYTLGKCMLTLSRIRGKFASLPGAGGGISMNAQDLANEGTTMIEECLADIDNLVISGLDQYGSSSLIVMG